MEINKKTMRKCLVLIAFGVILAWGLHNTADIKEFFAKLLGVLSPIIIGLVAAFILNVPMSAFEKAVFYRKGKEPGEKIKKLARPLSITVSVLFVFVLVLVIIFSVFPALGEAFGIIKAKAPAFWESFLNWVKPLTDQWPDIQQKILEFKIDWSKITQTATSFLQSGASNIINSTVSIASGVFSGLTNFILGIIFAIYVLAQKEKLKNQCVTLIKAYLKDNVGDRFIKVCGIANTTFSNFITGQCVEAVILGIMFFVTMLIFRFPYPLLVSLLIAVMSVVPIFGAFVGCFVGAFLILVNSPIQAIWFVIMFLLLQQIEGNLIYPRVVGGRVGLPAIWVLAAVTVGGGLMGVAGMLVGVPTASVLYTVIKESATARLEKKKQAAKENMQKEETDKETDKLTADEIKE